MGPQAQPCLQVTEKGWVGSRPSHPRDKVGAKHQSTVSSHPKLMKYIMTSDPITSWQIDGETMKTVTDFIFLGSKITADGDCSHEIMYNKVYF